MIVASTTSTQDSVLFGHMLPNPEKHPPVKKEFGQQFIDGLISPEGQRALADYKINGQQLFFPDANIRVRDDRQVL